MDGRWKTTAGDLDEVALCPAAIERTGLRRTARGMAGATPLPLKAPAERSGEGAAAGLGLPELTTPRGVAVDHVAMTEQPAP